MNTTVPAMNAERAAILHRRGVICDSVRSRAAERPVAPTCLSRVVGEAAGSRGLAFVASSQRLRVCVETPFAAIATWSPAYRADHAEPKRQRHFTTSERS